MKSIIPIEKIEQKIFYIRNQKVMMDRDLAELYGVETKVLNQAVKRNIKRFPKDFMFQLTKKEKNEVVTNCDHLNVLKYSPQLPYVFTEQGVAMLSSVLNSDRAVQVNIQIMRVFTKIRELVYNQKEVGLKLKQIETLLGKHDLEIKVIFDTIKKIIDYDEKPKRKIGFKIKK